MKYGRGTICLVVSCLLFLGGCAGTWWDDRHDTVLGVIVSQRVLVEGAPGSGVSVGVGAAGGSGGGSVFGLGVSVDLGQIFQGRASSVNREYSVRSQDGRLFAVRSAGEVLPDGSCVELVLDRNASAKSIRAAAGCVR